jgi:hypothetical protein
MDICRAEVPPMLQIGDRHRAACHLLKETTS